MYVEYVCRVCIVVDVAQLSIIMLTYLVEYSSSSLLITETKPCYIPTYLCMYITSIYSTVQCDSRVAILTIAAAAAQQQKSESESCHIIYIYIYIYIRNQVRSGPLRCGQVRPGQVRSGQVRSDQIRSSCNGLAWPGLGAISNLPFPLPPARTLYLFYFGIILRLRLRFGLFLPSAVASSQRNL